jgi:hypothetical protein
VIRYKTFLGPPTVPRIAVLFLGSPAGNRSQEHAAADLVISLRQEKQNDSTTTALIGIEPISLLNPDSDLISTRDPMKAPKNKKRNALANSR